MFTMTLYCTSALYTFSYKASINQRAGVAVSPNGWCDPKVMVQQYRPMLRAFELADEAGAVQARP